MGTDIDQMRDEPRVNITLDGLDKPDEQRQRSAQERKRPVLRSNIALPPVRRKAIDVHTYEEIHIREREHQTAELVPVYGVSTKVPTRNTRTYPIQKSVNCVSKIGIRVDRLHIIDDAPRRVSSPIRTARRYA